jgi:hypothetical protein
LKVTFSVHFLQFLKRVEERSEVQLAAVPGEISGDAATGKIWGKVFGKKTLGVRV